MLLKFTLKLIIAILGLSLLACSSNSKTQEDDSTKTNLSETGSPSENQSLLLDGNTIKTRYRVPKDFDRVSTTPGSFEEFLQNLPLKPIDAPTSLYNGVVRTENQYKASSVIDMDLDSLDIQHSVQSIIRLRAEYLYQTKQFDKISFIIKDNIPLDFIQWLQGYRIDSRGTTLKIKIMSNEKSINYQHFREYLREVFKFTDPESFKRNLHLIKDDDDNNEFGIGTIIMSKETPYDAMLVVDMVTMNNRHPYRFLHEPGVLVAHGDTPAQEIEILRATMDGLGIFPDNRGDSWKENAGAIWVTHTKGERQIQKQGGNIDVSLTVLKNKQLLKFNDYGKYN